MKNKSVKIKIKKLIKIFDGRKNIAEKLNIALSYVYRLEKGHPPGNRLYKDICELYNKTETKI